MQSLFDSWKPVIAKLSNKEPELVPTLIKVVLEMIETQEAVKHESGNYHLSSNLFYIFIGIYFLLLGGSINIEGSFIILPNIALDLCFKMKILNLHYFL